MLGRVIMDIEEGRKALELSQTMTESFRVRLVDLIDQAHHFANVGSMPGGSSACDPAQVFREGLDTTERELFTLARNSVKASKEWYDNGSQPRK
jgi:GINS complex subunit 3